MVHIHKISTLRAILLWVNFFSYTTDFYEIFPLCKTWTILKDMSDVFLRAAFFAYLGEIFFFVFSKIKVWIWPNLAFIYTLREFIEICGLGRFYIKFGSIGEFPMEIKTKIRYLTLYCYLLKIFLMKIKFRSEIHLRFLFLLFFGVILFIRFYNIYFSRFWLPLL